MENLSKGPGSTIMINNRLRITPSECILNTVHFNLKNKYKFKTGFALGKSALNLPRG